MVPVRAGVWDYSESESRQVGDVQRDARRSAAIEPSLFLALN
jgi:hypothetical protein